MKLLVLLDESVPQEIGRTFERAGHTVIYFEQALKSGSPDAMVARVAMENEAVLVAIDKDFDRFMRRGQAENAVYRKLELIAPDCPAPMAASRLGEAMSLLEHERSVSRQKRGRRLHVSIATHQIRTHR